MDKQEQSTDSPESVDPLQLIVTRLALVEALVLHRIEREERRLLVDDFLDRVQKLEAKNALSSPGLHQAAECLREASEVADAMDKLYKHPNHQGN